MLIVSNWSLLSLTSFNSLVRLRRASTLLESALRQRILSSYSSNRFKSLEEKDSRSINIMTELNINISEFRVENLDDVSDISDSIVSSSWSDVSQNQQSVATIDIATMQRNLEQMTIAFQKLNDEIIQLRAQTRASQETTQFVIASQAQSAFVLHFKKRKSKNQSSYKSESESEHIRWFREIEIEMLTCSSYFLNDRSKILWCMSSLQRNSQSQWFNRINDDKDLKNISYDYFKFFLLNLVADSMNRRLVVYENWERARQRSNQKVSSFKNELEKYETHLSSFDTIHSINFFFCKLLSSMKKKLLNIEKVSTIRKNLFAKIVMLKKIIERERRTDSRVQNNFNFFKQKEDKNKNKDQS